MARVTLTKQSQTLENFSQDPLNPYPPFPQLGTHAVYPYQFWGSVRRVPVQQDYYMPTLENEFLRVVIAPDIGGRVWELYDKIGARRVANFSSAVRTYNAGFGLNYTAGGIECNYPLAHSVTTSRQREVSTVEAPDGSASVIISEYEQIWRTRWSVAYTLYPDRSFLELRVRIYNRTPHDSRYMYWNNCGFVLNDDVQFIIPEEAGALHGKEYKTFSWPRWRQRDLSWFREVPEPIGLYMLDAREPFFGYYDHGNAFGLVHYGDLADLPGKKTWTWGKRFEASYRNTHHPDKAAYGEVQSGRIAIQEHLDRMPPETECEWTEIWYPVRDTGAFNSAGPGAVLRVAVEESAPNASRVRVVAMGNGTFPNATLVVTAGSRPVTTVPMPLNPKTATEQILALDGPASVEDQTAFVLQAANGQILARYCLRPPNERDSWREAVDYKRPVEAVGAERILTEASLKARDWGNHDLQPLYEAATALDPGLAAGRRELGKIAIWKGRFEEAVTHLEKVLEREPESFETQYHLGVALAAAGRTEAARKAWQMACRYDTEARALVRLAELSMQERDWTHALRYLTRLAESRPRLSRPRGLRSACLRKLGCHESAAAEIAAARVVDGQDPFLQFEQVFVDATARQEELAAAVDSALAPLLEQVRAAEPPLLEAAFDYLRAALYDEAKLVLDTIPNPGPLCWFVRAYVCDRMGDAAAASQALEQACSLDPTGHQAWRLEMIPILEWARDRMPASPRPLLHLGNLLMGRRRTEDGLALWRQARDLGEDHALLFANLGFYAARVAQDPEEAAALFAAAAAAAPDDYYVKHERFQALRASGTVDQARALLEADRDAVLDSPLLAHDLLTLYLEQRDYAAFDALCADPMDFHANFQIAGPHSVWTRRYLEEALAAMEAEDAETALRILRDMTCSPPRLGIAAYDPERDERRLYHMGCCHESLGDAEAARSCWEQVVACEHFMGYEPAYWFSEWTNRYYQALAWLKLGRPESANVIFDGLELLGQNPELPLAARQSMLDLAVRGRFAPDNEKDPAGARKVEVATRAET